MALWLLDIKEMQAPQLTAVLQWISALLLMVS